MFLAMQRTLLSERESGERLEITCNLNVVIAFEDSAAGRHAESFYEHLKQRLGDEFDLTRYQWSFSLLRDDCVRETAAHDAATADIIIIATHGAGGLPEHVRTWFQSWIGRNENRMALVALFDQPVTCSATRQEFRSALERVATAGGMDFFAEPDDSPNHSRTDFINRLAGL